MYRKLLSSRHCFYAPPGYRLISYVIARCLGSSVTGTASPCYPSSVWNRSRFCTPTICGASHQWVSWAGRGLPDHRLGLLHASCCWRRNGDPRTPLGRERGGQTPALAAGKFLPVCPAGFCCCGFSPSVLGGLGFAFLGGGEF